MEVVDVLLSEHLSDMSKGDLAYLLLAPSYSVWGRNMRTEVSIANVLGEQ